MASDGLIEEAEPTLSLLPVVDDAMRSNAVTPYHSYFDIWGSTVAEPQLFLCRLQHALVPAKRPRKTPFDSVTIPPVSIEDYVCSLQKDLVLEASVYEHAFCLLSRLGAANDRMLPTAYNVHRLTIVCILLAEKFLIDVPFDNRSFAHVGRLRLKELNQLELVALQILDWNIMPSEELQLPFS